MNCLILRGAVENEEVRFMYDLCLVERMTADLLISRWKAPSLIIAIFQCGLPFTREKMAHKFSWIKFYVRGSRPQFKIFMTHRSGLTPALCGPPLTTWN